MAERDNIQTILRRAGWTVQVAPLSATRYRMTAQREAPLEHRKRSANAVANLLRENGYSAGVVAVTVAGFDIDAKPIKAERAVVRAAKRAGLKVSDDSPRVIGAAVRMRAREWQKEKPTFDNYDNEPGDMALVDRAVRMEMYHWKRLIGTYPTLAKVARQTLIDAYFSPGGLATLWKRAADVRYIENFWRVVYGNLDTIAQYFEKQG